ncbi:MAG: AIPR family protein [Eubacteriales bacterium]|nr:AIPR family protein [Eubacteriales bacterium]
MNQKRTLLENYFYNVLAGYFINASESDPVTELARSIRNNLDSIKKLHIIIISTNKKSERLKTTFECKPFEAAGKSFDVDLTLLDIEGIYQTKSATFKKDDIFISTKEFGCQGIPCIKAEIESPDYDSYLAVVPGQFLSAIYLKYNARLLESNVRSFLNTRGKINKGILNTILNQKDRFFAYNNGISTTADSVEFSPQDGPLMITGFKNLQIINGGQTTASLAAAVLKNNANLNGIYVQMKLSIIKDETKKAELVRLISMYANKQNKVTEADLNSNHPFYQRIEDFSRRIKAPLAANSTVQSIWFFERARGQYDQAKMKLRTKRERNVFELQNPKAQRFTKTDLAKYINAADMKPFDVAWGAEVNMTKFGIRMQSQWEKDNSVFNEVYYKELIAKAIVYKRIEQIISDEDWYLENKGYRAQLVPYTFSKFIYEIEKLKMHFNYRKVWEIQKLPDVYESDIKRIAKLRFDTLYDPHRPIMNIGEYAKREICWNKLNETHIELSDETKKNLITSEEKQVEERAAKKDQNFSNEINSEIAIFNLGIDYWNRVLEVGTQLKELNPYEQSLCEVAIKYIKQIYRTLSRKQVKDLAQLKKKMDQYINPEAK